MEPECVNLNSQLDAVYTALESRSFFKLICGGSFSDTRRLESLLHVYNQAGIDAVDVSAALPVVEAAIHAMQQDAHPPLLMVSFPLDADPHFRKIELNTPACIHCGDCLPVCPTDVFALTDLPELLVDQPACYGCGRCLPVCPTQALSLDPFTVYPDLTAVLSKPEVGAVEIHTTYADPMMAADLYRELGPLLHNKLIAVCLRPQDLPLDQVLAFLHVILSQTPYPLIVQVDGNPMSATADPEASRPALEAARAFAPFLPENCYLTISGGINDITAQWLADPAYAAIQGVGMGTFARQAVWQQLLQPSQALPIAQAMVGHFRSLAKSDIMRVSSS